MKKWGAIVALSLGLISCVGSDILFNNGDCGNLSSATLNTRYEVTLMAVEFSVGKRTETLAQELDVPTVSGNTSISPFKRG